MRISDWSSDVCSSDLLLVGAYYREFDLRILKKAMLDGGMQTAVVMLLVAASVLMGGFLTRAQIPQDLAAAMLEFTDNKYVILFILNIFFLIIGFFLHSAAAIILVRSEEHTSELQSLMRISYAVFCLKK